MKNKNTITLARLRKIEGEIQLHSKESDDLKSEKRKIEEQLLLPKSTTKYLDKYFLKSDYFNKKEKMLIHVTEVTTAYEYKGVKIQFFKNGSVTIEPNYTGNFSSIGKEVIPKVWDEMVGQVYEVMSKI